MSRCCPIPKKDSEGMDDFNFSGDTDLAPKTQEEDLKEGEFQEENSEIR